MRETSPDVARATEVEVTGDPFSSLVPPVRVKGTQRGEETSLCLHGQSLAKMPLELGPSDSILPQQPSKKVRPQACLPKRGLGPEE